jgi:hypothetical protein
MPNWVPGEGGPDWTKPAVVIGRFPPPDEELWIVWVDGRDAVIEEKNYLIDILTSS